MPTGGHGKTERRNFRVRSGGWGTQARPSPRGRTVIRASRGVNLFRKSSGSAGGELGEPLAAQAREGAHAWQNK